MNFRFPVIVIDEDFRSENISGSGIRDLAEAIGSHGFEVIGYTSYVDLTAFAQQASRASCFILSIDDEEFGTGSAEEVAEGIVWLLSDSASYTTMSFLDISGGR